MQGSRRSLELITLLAAFSLSLACSGAEDDLADDGAGATSGVGGSAGTGAGTSGTAGASGAPPAGGTSGAGAGSGGSSGSAVGGGAGVMTTGGTFAGGASGSAGGGQSGMGGSVSAGTGGGAGSSGSAGEGGSAGFSGSAGASGSSGSAGAGGDGSSGQGGTAGGGGSAGTAGSSGNAGASGSSGAGGSAGAGGTGPCQKPSAPSEMQQTIDLTWDEMTGEFEGETGARPRSASILNFRNAILDQLMETGGTLNYCVRWESNATVSSTLRDQIEDALIRGVNEWFSKLEGYDCFPYTEIPVKVVGWATRDRNLLSWSDDSVPVYVNDIRENAPQCAEACGRFFHQQAGYTYPQCQGGIANHYDMSLWLTAGMQGGAGGDWGQRVGSEYFVNSVTQEHQHIWLHEFGHGFGFPDYYNWSEWVPGVAVPNSVMVAGLASQVTDWDTWMLRHLWSNVKSRYQ
jgi:hypothetical protein